MVTTPWTLKLAPIYQGIHSLKSNSSWGWKIIFLDMGRKIIKELLSTMS